ncbi:MAG TPA: hypothetical protein VNM47_02540 [Terriglobia bacterium]|nr:hypothetical protein [Terriglobia bacterium]
MEARDRLHMQDVGAKECRLTRADDIREDYWLDRIVGEELGPVLVVCGCAHVRWLAEKVKQRYGQEAERLYSPEFLRNRTVAEFYLDANGSPQTCKKPNQTP